MREASVDVAGEAVTAEGEHHREKPDGASDPAGEAGWYLEREREARGLTLDDAGAATGIHPYHLEAIEYGDMTRMPERIEALGMIGAYAQYLGFDPEPLIEHYAAFLSAPALAPKASHPANPAPLSSAKVIRFGLPKIPKLNFRPRGLPGGAGGLVASLAGAVFLFAGVSYMLMPGSSGTAPVDTVASTDAVPEDTPTTSATDPMPTASTGEQAANVSLGEEPMPDTKQLSEAPLDVPAASQAAEAPASEDDLAGTNLDGITSLIQKSVPEEKGKSKDKQGAAKLPAGLKSATDVALTEDGRQFGTDNGESRLTLKARAPVWVRIEDAQGNVVMTQMLMKGDTYRVPNREGLVVIARDGGLLSYVIDGKEKGILGTPGEILVGRSLDLKSFRG